MKADLEFTELRLTEAEQAAFLERVRSGVGPAGAGSDLRKVLNCCSFDSLA